VSSNGIELELRG